MDGTYSPQDLRRLFRGVRAGKSLLDLAVALGRSEIGVGAHLEKLSRQSLYWQSVGAGRVLKEYGSLKWRRPRDSSEKVEKSREEVSKYLREHPSATVKDLEEAGLSYHLSVGYDNRLNDARREVGIEESPKGKQPLKSRREYREDALDFIRDNPDAIFEDVKNVGYYSDLWCEGESITQLRIDAGVIPEDSIKAVEAAQILGVSKTTITNRIKAGKLSGFKRGVNLYLSRSEVEKYSR